MVRARVCWPAAASAAVAVVASAALIGPGAEEGATATGDYPVVMAAGDIAAPNSSGDNRTAALLGPADLVLALGDEAYPHGTLEQFNAYYHPSWGQYRAKTRSTPGNHEWDTAGASGYEAYFGQPDAHWYSFDLTGWHVIALDSQCSKAGGCDVGSPQYEWLKADLQRTTATCILAFWHRPRYSVGGAGDSTAVRPFWQLLYASRADVVLTGHDHNYQRWRQLDASGNPSTDGVREFVVGTGGAGLGPFARSDSRVQTRSASAKGVLELTLRPGAYDWRFLPVTGATFTDTGTTTCHTS